MNNFSAKAQGAMFLRCGLGYIGSSYNDLPATWIDFVASTTDTALLEITDQRLRVWIADALITRPSVATTISNSTFADSTGWTSASTGGTTGSSAPDIIPLMSGATTAGVTMSASGQLSAATAAWKAGDNSTATFWTSSVNVSTTPQWLKVDFGANMTVATYTVRASTTIARSPKDFKLQGSADASTWFDLDTQTSAPAWASKEVRAYSVAVPAAYRYYRIYITATQTSANLASIGETEMFETAVTGQALYGAQGLILNAQAVGSLAKVQRTVSVGLADIGIEHGLAINVTRGPVTFRCGSSTGDDDYVTETALGTGAHSLAFTPTGDFCLTFQNDLLIDRIVASCAVEAAGVMSVSAPWLQADLDLLRWDQSADVVFVACNGYQQQRIERRGSGRSWSVVRYVVDNGALYPSSTTTAKLTPGATYGNTTLSANRPFFKATHVGAVFSVFHKGRNQTTVIGAEDNYSEVIRVNGIGSDNTFVIVTTGTWVGTLTLQRSYDGADEGFIDVTSSYTTNATHTISPNASFDNVIQYYRIGFKPGDYVSGAVTVLMTYKGDGGTGFCRVISFNSSTSVNIEVLSPFADVTASDNWRESFWSDFRGWPSAVALNEGRLFWFGKNRFFGSVSDDFSNFSEDVTGDSGPMIRTIGSGPVDVVNFALSLAHIVIGTAGAEISINSSSLDEPLTPTNSGARPISTYGSALLRALRIDLRGFFVNRSGQKAFELDYDGNRFRYVSKEVTILSPDVLYPGVDQMAVQRQLDTRIHMRRTDGTVAAFLYEPEQEITCFSTISTDGTIEKMVSLPGTPEDRVYYHVNRTINGVTKRYLEKFSLESECVGGGSAIGSLLNKQADAFLVYSQAASSTVTGLSIHEGKQVIVWNGNIPVTVGGVTTYGDAERDNADAVKLFTVTGGQITGLSLASTTGVVGLPYDATWKSSKLAYGAQAGTALNQPKRIDNVGFILANTHMRGLKAGADFTTMRSLPLIYRGTQVTEGRVYASYDEQSVAFPGPWDADSRLCLKASAPRPCRVMAAVLTMATSEKI